MLPVIEPDGRRTGRQAVLYAAALLPVSLVPTFARRRRRRVSRRSRSCSASALLWLAVAVRGDAQRRRRARAVLRLDHLPAAALDRDDRRTIAR